jgi:triacylglycerol lipase
LAHQGQTPFNVIKPGNNYPIIFVNGFFGWGHDEVFGYNYWGGSVDLHEELRIYGYEIYSATVGPFSSNWDRACELYAYIKGGTVDYGRLHAQKFGHERYGRTYPGLYPQWSETHKIHLIGHSMGGNTSRLLVQLLENGYPDEVRNTPEDELSPLFTGGKRWIHSVTSIASPHDGTTLMSAIDGFYPFLQKTIAQIARHTDSLQENFYDLKLDQWGLRRRAEESRVDYRTRVAKSAIWKETRDFSTWDNLPVGAKEFNRWVKASPHVYYLSWATQQTRNAFMSDRRSPKISMLPCFLPFSMLMGTHSQNKPDQIIIDETWRQNDGIVNTRSMAGPTLGSTDQVIPYDGIIKPGVWNFMGVLESCDHSDILGIGSFPGENCPAGYDNLTEWYFSLADILGSLPSAEVTIATDRESDGYGKHENPTDHNDPYVRTSGSGVLQRLQ